MSLDETNPPITIEQAVQHGKDELIQELESLARQEAERGDSRALLLVSRFLRALGYRHARK